VEKKFLVPFFKPFFDRREISEIDRIMRQGVLSGGENARLLEKEFSSYVGSKYAIAVDSCTSGLFLSMKCNGIGQDDVVTMPSLTFASPASMVLHCGAKINWEDESYVGKAYHLKNDRIFKIVDSAHQIERGMYYPLRGAMVSYSFYPTKQISSAEGGMICLDDYYAMEWLDRARWNGRKGNGYNYSIDFPGWKMNMTDMQAVIALVQLDKLDDKNRRVKAIVDYYNQELEEKVDSLHLYTIEVDNRDDFIRFMSMNGVSCSVHFYTPLHRQPAFKQCYKELPKTDMLAKRTVSLPLFPSLREEQAMHVVDLVKKWRENESK